MKQRIRVHACAQEPNGRQLARLLRVSRKRPGGCRAGNTLDEITPSHRRPQGSEPVRTMLWNDAITAGKSDRRNRVRLSFCAATILRTECPLWVKSRHRSISNQCLLYPQKRTLKSRALQWADQQRADAASSDL